MKVRAEQSGRHWEGLKNNGGKGGGGGGGGELGSSPGTTEVKLEASGQKMTRRDLGACAYLLWWVCCKSEVTGFVILAGLQPLLDVMCMGICCHFSFFTIQETLVQ